MKYYKYVNKILHSHQKVGRGCNYSNLFGLDKKEGLKDLEQEGYVFLVEAIRSYSPAIKCSLSTYVYTYIESRYTDLERKMSSPKFNGETATIDPESRLGKIFS